MFEYMTAQEAANNWNISVWRVQRLCKENQIDGAMNINRVCLIPKTAKKPADGRYKINKEQKNEINSILIYQGFFWKVIENGGYNPEFGSM